MDFARSGIWHSVKLGAHKTSAVKLVSTVDVAYTRRGALPRKNLPSLQSHVGQFLGNEQAQPIKALSGVSILSPDPESFVRTRQTCGCTSTKQDQTVGRTMLSPLAVRCSLCLKQSLF